MPLILLAQTTDVLHYHGLTHEGYLFSAHGKCMIYSFASAVRGPVSIPANNPAQLSNLITGTKTNC